MYRRAARKYDLAGDFNNPTNTLHLLSAWTSAMSIRYTCRLANLLWHYKTRAEASASFKLWFKFRNAIYARVFELLVRMEIGWISCGIESIGTVNKGSAESDRRCILDL
jgi:hypothetical protein